MRLCTYREPGGTRLGRVEGDRVVPLRGRDVRDALAGAPPEDGPSVALAGLDLAPPLRPGTLLGVGLNYRDHAAETGAALPAEPLLFAKLPGSVAGAGDPVTRPSYTEAFDYEGELAVVIGRRARRVPPSRAIEHVFGYAVMNDFTSRDRQRDEPQWIRAKGADGSAPFGPWVTTAEEVPDPQALPIETLVNGERRQSDSTAAMVFGVAELIAWCSESFTLEPGDVITTGTPAGVGVARRPPLFLVPGDRVRVEIAGLGALDNVIR